jgi:hypothetical protein
LDLARLEEQRLPVLAMAARTAVVSPVRGCTSIDADSIPFAVKVVWKE